MLRTRADTPRAGRRHTDPVGARGGGRLALALARSCHPLPTIAVTALGTALAAAGGRSPGGCLLVAAALLSGQLSIGWLNDLLDRDRDAAAGRGDKPVARGDVPPRVVAVAAVLAAGACVPLSLASGWRAAAASLTVVAAGWSYDLGLKGTVYSPLPYAVAFGALPAFVTYGLPGAPAPPWWLVLAGALLGVGAHGANVLPDLADDAATGVRGLPHRLGATWTRRLAAALLLGAVVVLAAAPPGPPGGAGVLAAAVAALLAVTAVVGPGGRTGQLPFRAAIGTGAVAVALLVARGGLAG